MLVLAVSVSVLAQDPAPELPSGSADYRRTISLLRSFTARKTTFAQFTQAVVALELTPHGLGCEYQFLSPPPPPPGVSFEPKLMPSDWVGTFGEVAMLHLGGFGLDRKGYDALHRAAHGTRPGFPNCGRPRRP